MADEEKPGYYVVLLENVTPTVSFTVVHAQNSREAGEKAVAKAKAGEIEGWVARKGVEMSVSVIESKLNPDFVDCENCGERFNTVRHDGFCPNCNES